MPCVRHSCSSPRHVPPPLPQVEVDFTARVADTGKVYDGSRGFEFTLGQGEASRSARRLLMLAAAWLCA